MSNTPQITKGHKLDQKAKRYILSAINSEGYDVEPLSTNKQKIEFLEKTFIAEYGWHYERYGNIIISLKEWLQGLPSCLDIVFYYSDIIDLAVQWGSLPKEHSETQAQKITDNYWNFMANKINQLFNGYAIPQEF